MATFLAAIRLDPDTRRFEIRSPDFPDLARSCDDLSLAYTVAQRAIRARVRQELASRGQVDRPTERTELAGQDALRASFVVPVDVETGSE